MIIRHLLDSMPLVFFVHVRKSMNLITHTIARAANFMPRCEWVYPPLYEALSFYLNNIYWTV